MFSVTRISEEEYRYDFSNPGVSGHCKYKRRRKKEAINNTFYRHINDRGEYLFINGLIMSKRKRGPYKRYLLDDSNEIPVITKRSRLTAKKWKRVKQMEKCYDE